MIIHRRTEWGFDGWGYDPYPETPSRRDEIVLHHNGSTPVQPGGAGAKMRSMHADHKSRGWAGIGYNFVIFQDGSVWEGRGYGLVGAHCPGHNLRGIGIQLHVGGRQVPTPVAMTSLVTMISYTERVYSREMRLLGHRDAYSTDCPGDWIEMWMKAYTGIDREKHDMELTDMVQLGPGARHMIKEITGEDVSQMPVEDLLQRVLGQVLGHGLELAALRNEVELMRGQAFPEVIRVKLEE